MQSLQQFKTVFEPQLEDFFKKKRNACRGIIDDQDILSIVNYAHDLTTHGGKRLRPYVATLGSRIQQDSAIDITPIAIALEIFHLFALIHDDVMDKGTQRHGIPTTHRFVSEKLHAEHRLGDLDHIGASQAILLGDLLLSWANQAWSLPLPSLDGERYANAHRLFFTMVDEVLLGQMLDVDLASRSVASLPCILEKMRLKTSSYSFTRPLQIGAVLAGAGDGALQDLEHIGTPLGLAFQIQDDLLDLVSTPTDSTKTAFSDLSDRQHTIFTEYILTHGTAADREELSHLFGAKLTEDDRLTVVDLFGRSGAIRHGQERIQTYFDQAKSAIHHSSLPDPTKHELRELGDFLRHRTL